MAKNKKSKKTSSKRIQMGVNDKATLAKKAKATPTPSPTPSTGAIQTSAGMETPQQTLERAKSMTSGQPTTEPTQPSDALKNLSIGLAGGTTPPTTTSGLTADQQMSEDIAQAIRFGKTQSVIDQMKEPVTDPQVNQLDQMGYQEGDVVPGQGTLTPGGYFNEAALGGGGTMPQGTQANVNEAMAGQAGQMEQAGAPDGYVKVGPAYFQRSSDGLRAVTDPSVIQGLKHGTIPYATEDPSNPINFSRNTVPVNTPTPSAQVEYTQQNPMDSGSLATTYDSYKSMYGFPQDANAFFSDPIGTIKTMTETVYKMMGMDDANRAIKNISKELEQMENKRDGEIRDTNEDPWLTEGERLRRIDNVNEKYEDEINNRVNKLSLLEDVRNNAQQQAQFALGTAISLWDKERTFQQNQINMWNEQAQRAIDNDFKLKDYNMSMETTYINDYLRAKENGYEGTFFDFTHPEAKGGTSDWQMFNAGDGSTMMYNQRTGAIVPVAGGGGGGASGLTAQQEKDLAVVNDIENVLADTGFNSAFGLTNIVNRNLPGSPAFNIDKNISNIISQLALAARGQLKGQGAVSDFEGKLLRQAQTALSMNMNPDQARFELRQVKGAIRTSSGLTATVRITAPDGTSKVGQADQAMITQAIASGYRVQYE